MDEGGMWGMARGHTMLWLSIAVACLGNNTGGEPCIQSQPAVASILGVLQ